MCLIYNVLQTGHKLHDFNIEAWHNNAVTICAVVGSALKDSETRTFNCPKETFGRFITIRRITDTIHTLQLCEVEVYGRESK